MKTPRMLCAFMLALSMMTASLLRGGIFTTLNNNDPAPMYTTAYTYNYLNTYYKEFLKGHMKTPYRESFVFDITPFYQRATTGWNYLGNKEELGNLQGRWNMIALLPFNNIWCPTTLPIPACTAPVPPIENLSSGADLPCGQQFPTDVVAIRDQLLIAIANNFTSNSSYPADLHSIQGLLQIQQTPGLQGNFGYFSVPITYRKTGLRFNLQGMLFKDIGLTLCGGVASIYQLPSFTDLTSTTTANNPFSTSGGGPDFVSSATWVSITKNISAELMANNCKIARAYGYDIGLFRAASIEDLNGELFWRHAIPINKHARLIPTSSLHETWTKFLFTPFFALGGSIALAKEKCYSKKFSLPFGNNGSNAFRVRAGLSLDFFDTVELAGEVGFTHFQSRVLQCPPFFAVPNNGSQEGIFPFGTTVCWRPGNNTHATLTLNAYNFWSTVSYYLQYVVVSHAKDEIILPGQPSTGPGTPCSSTAFNPCVPHERSWWKTNMFNTALNVEISPNFRLGGGAQISLAGTNVYNVTTFLITLEMGF